MAGEHRDVAMVRKNERTSSRSFRVALSNFAEQLFQCGELASTLVEITSTVCLAQ